MTLRRLPRLPVHRGIERLEDRLLLTGSSILETESNNSIALANPVTIDANSPAEVTGAINVGGDVDLYQVSLGFGDTFTAALTGYDPNIQYSLVSDLRLFDSSGNELSNVPFGFSDPTLQFTNNTAGTTTFYLGVSDITNTAYDATNADNQGDPAYQFIGAYTLDLSVTSLVDAGDTLGSATDVPSTPIQLSGIVDTGGDADLYHVFLNAGDTLDVATDTSILGGLGTNLRLFDQQGQPISTTGTANHVNFVAAAAGDYYLGVSADDNTQYDVNTSVSGSGTATGDYFVNFLVTPQDHDDTTGTADHISFLRDQPPSQLAGRIANPLDVDFYQLDRLVVGDKIHLAVGTASVGSSLSSRLRVFGPNGQVNPDSGTGLDAAQTYTVSAAGTYFIGISGAEDSNYNPTVADSGAASSSIGDYQLGIEVDSAAALATEAESNNSINTPNVVLASGGSISGSITSGDVDYYMFTVSQPGQFTAQVSTPGSNLDSQLTIFGSDQQPLFTSDDSSLGNVDPSIQMHLVAGTYWLQVKASAAAAAAAGAKTGAYALSTTFTPANSPFVPQPTGPDDSSGLYPYAIDAADLNADGIPDLVTADVGTNQVSILLGIKVPGTSRGDFSYKPATVVDVGNTPVAITANLVTLSSATAKLDFNSDGNADLALINLSDNTVEILLGDGAGGFTPGEIITVGNSPTAVVAADFNNDGVADLAVTNSADGTVTILLGDKDANNHGTGTFTLSSPISVGNPLASPSDPPISSPRAIIAGDFDGDGKLDLATADTGDDTVTVLYGNGQGGFGVNPQDLQVLQLPSGSQPTSLVAAKFNSKVNSFIGFAVANSATDNVSMILGQGNRTFQINDPIVVRNLPQITVASEYMTSVATADFNGDGLADLVVSNIADPLVTVALGNGNGTFAPGKQYIHNATNSPRGIVTGDFNNDGRADFATADGIPAAVVSIFGGRGDGTFLGTPRLQTNQAPLSLVVSDFNDDGFADIFTANGGNGSLFSGNGDATFQNSTTVNAGPGNAVATGDFNGDGRPDVVVTNYLDPNSGVYIGQLTVLLGNGDGTFVMTDSGPITLTPGDFAVAVGDFDHDGHLDLAVTNQFDGTLTVLFGDGSGSFTAQTPITVGSSPEALAVGDFNGDGNLDIVTSNFGDGTLSVLFGDGVGGFATPQTVAVGQQPGQLAVANFNGDISSSGHAIQDIAVKSSIDSVVRILLGVEDGADSDNFTNANLNPVALPVSDGTHSAGYPEGIVAADFNGDGLPDLATASAQTFAVSVFLNLGNGQFSAEQLFAIGDSTNGNPTTIVSADFNRDGRLDLATTNAGTNNVSILLGEGNGQFALPGQFGSSNSSKAPLLVDVNGDGVPDSITMDAQGRVQLRLGRPGQPGVFAPPLVINATSIAAGVSAADFALFNDGSQNLLGILNRATAQNSQNSTFTLYRINHAGLAQVVTTLQLGDHYDRLVSAKLNGDNRDDLAVLNSAGGTLAKFFRSGSGFVANGASIQIANAPTGLQAANFGGGIDSLLVTSSQTGTVNLLSGSNTLAVDYRNSTNPLGFDAANSSDNTATPFNFDGDSTLAIGNFNDLDDSLSDMVVAHAGTNTLSVLLGKSSGGFVDPQSGQEIQTGSKPIAVAAGKFNADKHLDLAVLEADGHVQIFLGDGHGNFQIGGSYDVGTAPVGLAVYKVNADNKNDLMISNRSGDVVTLLGNGNGTFRTFTRVGQSMGLAVGDGNVVVTNQSGDRVVVPGSQVSQRSDGVNAPTAVRLTDNKGNPIHFNPVENPINPNFQEDIFPDMVVANSGGNNVLVYLGVSGGGFDLDHPISFSAGTDPVDVEVADVNGDGKLDVIVTNYGSNDVSILLGTGDASNSGKNLFTPGVRLNVGQGPISTQVVLQPGHANPDLLVTNSISNSVYLLPGVGGGFFNDVTPTQFQTGNTPVQTVVGNFNGQMGFVTLNYASNSLTFYSSFSGGGAGQEISSGGSSPLSAVSFGLNSDGTTNLIVGNNGDGVFSVFEGSQAGLSLVNTFSGDFLEHPAALAVSGQGNDLQLLALDEGDETVHVFNRDTVDGQTQQTFIPGQTELAGVATGFLGSNTTGFGFVVSLIGALGISVEGFLDSTFTSDAAGGDGKYGHPFSTQFFEDLGSALNSGQQWVGSAVEGLGGMLGVHLDDQEVGAAVEDVMSLIFPHLPLQALPSLIHGMLESATHSHPSSPFATDQALENFEFSPLNSSNTEVLFDVAQLARFLSPTDLVQPSLMPLVKSLADGATSAFAPRATAPSDVAAGQGSTENDTTESIPETPAQVAVSPITSFAPQAIAMSRKLASDNSHHRVSKALQMSLGLPVSIPPALRNQKSNQQTHKFNPNLPAAAEMEGAPGQLFALAAVMGSIGVGGWAHRFRRNRKHSQS